jgi:hypothetical protein
MYKVRTKRTCLVSASPTLRQSAGVAVVFALQKNCIQSEENISSVRNILQQWIMFGGEDYFLFIVCFSFVS